ncbi:hypothetical protein FACS189429_6720 [Bacteroidia bacterium]|nr:hypothetical protein FACS189429_6720 [Bacteroidia bacterium]
MALAGCDKDISYPDNLDDAAMLQKTKAYDVDKKQLEEYNSDFETVAFAVNKLLIKNATFGKIVHTEVEKMFDGDYDVLISQIIVNHPETEKWFNAENVEIRQMVEKHPLMQIAIPMSFELWDGGTSLPTVYLPGDYNEGVTKFITGYDKSGKAVAYEETYEPEFPVAVISQNERVKLISTKSVEDLTPSAPTNLVATKGTMGIYLTWQKPATGEVSGYEVYRKGYGDASFQSVSAFYGQNEIAYFDMQLLPNRDYTYYVKAFYEVPSFAINTSNGKVVLYVSVFNVFSLNTLLFTRYYSIPSNTASALSPTVPIPSGMKLEHGNSGQLDLEWTGQSSPYVDLYEVWRKSTESPTYTLQGTTAGINNFFLQNALSAGVFYRYRVRSKTASGGYSEWSPSIATSASERNVETAFKLTSVKFKDKAAAKKTENWGGAPELRLKVAKGDNFNNAVIIKTIDYEPASFKKSYSQWNNANKIILNNWNPNRDGTVFTFSWTEVDGNDEDIEVKVSTTYENKLDENTTLKVSGDATYKRDVDDEVMGQSIVTWWNPKSTEFEVDPGFNWKIE